MDPVGEKVILITGPLYFPNNFVDDRLNLTTHSF